MIWAHYCNEMSPTNPTSFPYSVFVYVLVFVIFLLSSPRWVPYGLSGGTVPWCGPWGLWLQCPSDRRVHINDHRIHYGGHLCPIYAASVPHGLSVAFYALPSSSGRWRFLWWHISPKVNHIKLTAFKLFVKWPSLMFSKKGKY